MTPINTFILNATSAMGSTTLTALLALTTIASVARFF